MFIIREYIDTDKEQLISLMREFEEYLKSTDTTNYLIFKDLSTEYSVDRMRQQVKESNGTILVAEENDKLLGFVEAYVKNQTEEEKLAVGEERIIHIEELFVSQKVRGHGIGTALLDNIGSKCKALGCNTMTLDVHATNTLAHEYYKKHNFIDKAMVMMKKLS